MPLEATYAASNIHMYHIFFVSQFLAPNNLTFTIPHNMWRVRRCVQGFLFCTISSASTYWQH